MKLVLMTKSTFFVEEDKILTTLFDEGLDNLHLHKPQTSPLYSERLLSLLPEDIYKKIVVHQHFYLKDEYGLAGIHLDDYSTTVPKDYHGRISRTCSDLGLLKDMRINSSYVFLNNIFKKNDSLTQSFTMKDIENAASNGLINKYTYVLGGITIDNISICKELGFGGVVICEDLWDRFDIHSQNDYKNLIEYYSKLLNKAG